MKKIMVSVWFARHCLTQINEVKVFSTEISEYKDLRKEEKKFWLWVLNDSESDCIFLYSFSL